MAMNAHPFGFDLSRFAESGRSWSAAAAFRHLRPRPGGLLAALIAALGVWIMVSGQTLKPAKHPAVRTTGLAQAQPVKPSAATAAVSPSNPADALAQMTPAEGLRISSQSWRRGGLGSKALVTLTLRNDNDYAVGDIGLLCSFSRPDGGLVTERRPTIHDTIKMKSRKTFVRIHVGYVNVTAAKANCAPVSASRV
jgi:hypothetical protein